MESSTANQITTPGNHNFFLSPQFPLQRQYEALRALLVDEEPSADCRPSLRLLPRRLPRPLPSVPPRPPKTRFLLPPATTRSSNLPRPRPRPRFSRSHAQTQSFGL